MDHQVTTSGLSASKRPATPLAGPYGHPLHPVLVSVPIGAWVASVVFDLAAFLVDDSAFLVQGAWWLVGLGVLGALAAASVGFLDLLVLPSGTRAHRTALLHMSVNLTATALFAVGFWLRASHNTAQEAPWGLVALSLLALALVGVGGLLGGELAYRFGVRVADEATQREAFRTTD